MRKKTAKEKSTTSFQGILWEEVPLYVLLTRAVLRSCTVSIHATPSITGTADIGENFRTSVQQHLPQQEIQRTDRSA
jgi:hypothetical protein